MMAYLLAYGLFTCAPGTHVTRQAPDGTWITVRHEQGTSRAINWWSDSERAKRGRVFEVDEVEAGTIPTIRKSF